MAVDKCSIVLKCSLPGLTLRAPRLEHSRRDGGVWYWSSGSLRMMVCEISIMGNDFPHTQIIQILPFIDTLVFSCLIELSNPFFFTNSRSIASLLLGVVVLPPGKWNIYFCGAPLPTNRYFMLMLCSCLGNPLWQRDAALVKPCDLT